MTGPDLPADRRPLAKNEHLFVGRKHKGAHLWLQTQRENSGVVVACGLCGKLKKGETMPSDWPPLIR